MNEDELKFIQLLRQSRLAPAPARSRERVTARLGAILAALGGASAQGPASAGETGAVGPGAVQAGVLGSRTLVALALLCGSGAGAGIHAALSSPPPPRVVYIGVPTPVIEPAVETSSATATARASAPLASSAPAAATSSVPASAPPSPPVLDTAPAALVPSRQLDAERALLDEARASLSRGSTAPALAALDRHEHAYARPILGEEREALRIQVLVVAGRHDEARARGAEFQRKSPNSLFTGAVRSALASIP